MKLHVYLTYAYSLAVKHLYTVINQYIMLLVHKQRKKNTN